METDSPEVDIESPHCSALVHLRLHPSGQRASHEGRESCDVGRHNSLFLIAGSHAACEGNRLKRLWMLQTLPAHGVRCEGLNSDAGIVRGVWTSQQVLEV